MMKNRNFKESRAQFYLLDKPAGWERGAQDQLIFLQPQRVSL
jgi:hypothetical protein